MLSIYILEYNFFFNSHCEFTCIRKSRKYCISLCTDDLTGRWQSQRIYMLSENSYGYCPITIIKTISI